MLDFTPIKGDYRISDADRTADAAAPSSMMIRWLETQDQEVWGRAILGAEGSGQGEEAFLLWMVDRKLDRANAIRLFWKLYRPEYFLGQESHVNDTGRDGPKVFAALKAILSRFSLGRYPEGMSGLSKDEARYYRLIWRDGIAQAVKDGFDAKRGGAFQIPAAFFQAQPGRALQKAPTIRPVGPAPEWMDTDLETAFARTGTELRDLAGADQAGRVAATMHKRLRAGRRDAAVRYGGVGGAVTMAATIVVTGGGDLNTLVNWMGPLLH